MDFITFGAFEKLSFIVNSDMIKLITLLRPYARYLLIAWAITIIVVSSTPNIPTLKINFSKGEIRLDYLIHFLEYGALTGLSFLTFTGAEFRMGAGKALKLTAILCLFAILDEYHQKLIPGRSFNYVDILSNLTGIITGVMFCIVIFRIIVHKSVKTE